MNNCNEIGVVNVEEIPVLEYASQADYFMGIAAVTSQQSGEVVQSAVLIPSEAVVPQGNSANQFPLEMNNTLVVPTGQVVPAYVQQGSIPNTVLIADSSAHCDFLIVAIDNGVGICQSTGVLNFPMGHEYKVIGAQYYLSSTPGKVTTNASETGRKLFKAISRTQLLINM